MFDRLAQCVGSRLLTENVAGDDQYVDVFLAAVAGDVFNRSADVGCAVDPAESVAKVPIAGMKQAHEGIIQAVQFQLPLAAPLKDPKLSGDDKIRNHLPRNELRNEFEFHPNGSGPPSEYEY